MMMAILRMDHVGVVVDDLEGSKVFFVALGMELEGEAPNALGLRNIMFAVDDIDATVATLRAYGGELVGEVAQYESSYRLCYVRGPERITVALAEQL